MVISRHSASRGFCVLWGPSYLLTLIYLIRINEGNSPARLTNPSNRHRYASWQPTASLPRPRWRGCWFSFPERIACQHRHTSSSPNIYRGHLSSNLSPICFFRRHMVKPSQRVARGAFHTVCKHKFRRFRGRSECGKGLSPVRCCDYRGTNGSGILNRGRPFR